MIVCVRLVNLWLIHLTFIGLDDRSEICCRSKAILRWKEPGQCIVSSRSKAN